MTAAERFRAWRNRRRRRRTTGRLSGSLREFVYLDDVSLYSLLASRKGAIATEFTDSETASLNSEVGGSLGGGFGAAKAEMKSRVESGLSQTTQVLRKAIVQTSFKELRDLEGDRLAIGTPDGEPPAFSSVDEMASSEASLAERRWVVDPLSLRRGDLLEAEVTLEAEPIFRVSAVITTLREVMQENLQLFGGDPAQFADMHAVGRMLESLLAGLVPVRGRLADFEAVELNDREVLVRRGLLDKVPETARPSTRPVFLVGVAQRDLFWKDIRRVLFSNAPYSVFCRLSANELADHWRPVKLIEVLAEVHPMFGELIGDLGETAMLAMEAAVDASQSVDGKAEQNEQLVIERFSTLLAEHHGKTLDGTALVQLASGLMPSPGWMDSVDQRRPVLAEVQRLVDSELGVVTPAETAANLRMAALVDSHLGLGGVLTGDPRAIDAPSAPDRTERYLNAEIVAVYW